MPTKMRWNPNSQSAPHHVSYVMDPEMAQTPRTRLGPAHQKKPTLVGRLVREAASTLDSALAFPRALADHRAVIGIRQHAVGIRPVHGVLRFVTLGLRQ